MQFKKIKKAVSLSIFEVGFGTGLNALLTANWAKKK
jgi:tRNA U34 5-methylaminomethyl-2-thiouridine-forming methyltransferase MnmC